MLTTWNIYRSKSYTFVFGLYGLKGVGTSNFILSAVYYLLLFYFKQKQLYSMQKDSEMTILWQILTFLVSFTHFFRSVLAYVTFCGISGSWQNVKIILALNERVGNTWKENYRYLFKSNKILKNNIISFITIHILMY